MLAYVNSWLGPCILWTSSSGWPGLQAQEAGAMYIHQCTGHHVAHGHSLTLTLSQLQEQQKEPGGIYLATLCFSKGAVLQ